jgi:hypothetical protein
MKKTTIASIVAGLACLVSLNPLTASAFEQKLTQNDGFEIGGSVVVSGNVALVGAPKSNSNKGAAYVYTRTCPTCTWTLSQRLTASDGVSSDRFGIAVAFDGSTMLIGATTVGGGSGAAYTFYQSGGAWVQSQKLVPHDGAANDEFGYSVAVAGQHILIGAYGANVNNNFAQGAAYRYYRVGGGGSAYLEAEKLTAADGAFEDEFGWSVALTQDVAFIGARDVNLPADCPYGQPGLGCRDAGAVYIFDNPCSTGTCGPHWTQSQRLVAASPNDKMNFGFSVAVAGTTAIISAPYSHVGLNERQGTAFIYSKQVGGWSQDAQLLGSDGAAHDQFGTAVSMLSTGLGVAVGAEFGSPTSNGSTYVFAKSGLVWNQTNKLSASDAFHLGGFGISVGYSGSTVLVGSPYTPDGSRGAAYSYTLP